MTDPGATATLQLALALLSMPSQRRLLRRWPLPEDTLLLARVAAGSSEALEVATRATGEAPERLQEAARFYLEEVMFFEGADAYRVLGLNPGAETVLIKQHYRQLQRWLHPDRAGQDATSGLAARVNWAWDQLRSVERRRAYDALLAPASMHSSGSGAADEMVNAPIRWVDLAETQPGRHSGSWLKAWWFGTLGACSLILLGIALWQSRMAPPEWQAGQRHVTAEILDTANTAGASEAPSVSLAEAEMPTPLPEPFAEDASISVVQLVAADADDTGPAMSPTTLTAARLPDVPVVVARIAPVSAVDLAPVPESQAPSTPVTPTPEQIRAAHERLRQMAGFLASPTAAPPPLWHDVAALDSAIGQRSSLYSTRRSRDVDFSLHDPQWQVSHGQAEVGAAYRLEGRGGTAGVGRLYMSLVWREDRWLVSGLRLEPER